MSRNSYYDDDMSEEDYERVMEHMYELECELEEPHDARTDQLIREELEDLSSAMLFEPVVKNGEYLGERDHVPGYWTDRRDLESESSGASSEADEVEKDEPFTDAVIREVFEETGLTISIPQLCGVKDWFREDGTRYVVHLYKTNQFHGILTPSHEGEVFWVNRKDLSKMELASGMESTLKIFLDEKLSEQFVYKKDGEWLEILK